MGSPEKKVDGVTGHYTEIPFFRAVTLQMNDKGQFF